MLQLHLSDQQFYCLLRCTLYKRFDGIQKIMLLDGKPSLGVDDAKLIYTVRQNGCHFAHKISRFILLCENQCFWLKIFWNFAPKGQLTIPVSIGLGNGLVLIKLQAIVWNNNGLVSWCIWVRSLRCYCLVTWFCYQLIAKPGTRQPNLRDLTHISMA